MKNRRKLLAAAVILVKAVAIPPVMMIEDVQKQVRKIKYWKSGNNPRNI